ncbi:hypothetical protein BDF22DRAFT_777329 [Syncephalis plumigaleata]|nr:hypothetical protein BDF22DRAFT_777329 [Syncephalis plumigaleata]
MASNVVISYDNGHRRQVVKTTPMMPLTAIVSTVVEKHKLGDPASFALKYKQNPLDMSLTVRFANLPPGASLDLVKQKRTTTNAQITIAVQLDDGESDGALNLTKRQVLETSPEKTNKLRNWLKKESSSGTVAATPPAGTYLQPVCMLMNREYTSMTTLQNTTFASIGLTSGNAVMRVSFRASDQSLADILSASDVSPPSSSDKVAEKSTATLPMNKSDDHIVVDTSSVNDDNSHTRQDNEDIATVEQENVVLPSITADLPAPSAVISEMEVDNTQTNLSNDSVSDTMDTKEPINTSTETANTDETSATTTTIDRMLRVFRAPPPGTPIAHHQIDLPDSFFELTPLELKTLWNSQQAKRQAQENAPLLTSAMRKAEEEKRKQRYPKTMIRVRFPDRVQLQLQFLSRETVGKVYQVVRQYLHEPSRPFTLYTTPPRNNLTNMDIRLIDAQLAPASVLHFSWNQPAHEDGTCYLKEELVNLAEDLPELATNTNEVVDSPTVDPVVASTSSCTDNNSAASTLSLAESDRRSNTSNSGSVKLPKWMKLSKCDMEQRSIQC